MNQYASKEVSAAVTRRAAPDELWLSEQIERINPDASEMGNDAGYTQALTALVFELHRENQRLQGEAKVIRDLLNLTLQPLETLLPEADHPAGEYESLSILIDQINSALRGAT